MKQQQKENDKDTKFIKEAHDTSKQFILQKNKKTIIATIIIVSFLLLLIFGIVVSGVLL